MNPAAPAMPVEQALAALGAPERQPGLLHTTPEFTANLLTPMESFLAAVAERAADCMSTVSARPEPSLEWSGLTHLTTVIEFYLDLTPRTMGTLASVSQPLATLIKEQDDWWVNTLRSALHIAPAASTAIVSFTLPHRRHWPERMGWTLARRWWPLLHSRPLRMRQG